MKKLQVTIPLSCLLSMFLKMVVKKYLVSVACPMAECCAQNPKEGLGALPERQ